MTVIDMTSKGDILFASACADTLQRLTDLATRCCDETPDLDVHVRIYARLKLLLAELRQTARDLEARVGDEIVTQHGKTYTVSGIGEVKANWTADGYEWDMAGYLGELVGKAMDERAMVCDAEGNKLPVHLLGHNVAQRILECAAVTYGRVKLAEAHGVDARKYRASRGGGRRTIQLPRQEL